MRGIEREKGFLFFKKLKGMVWYIYRSNPTGDLLH
jgi:hypothetical protein